MHVSRETLSEAFNRWALAQVESLGATGRHSYHYFWDVWREHASKIEALSISPVDRDYYDTHMQWFYEMADHNGFYGQSVEEVGQLRGQASSNG